MQLRLYTKLALLAITGLMLATQLHAGDDIPATQPSMKETFAMHASGTFTVEMKPLTFDGATDDKQLGRLSLSKHFSGDLVADSVGEMLSAMTATEGSAGYVAMERVTGTLQARTGSFVLQHSGTMNRGVPTLSVTVVPDSGTGDLTGISGRMTIDIREGRHFYTFDYALPASAAARD